MIKKEEYVVQLFFASNWMDLEKYYTLEDAKRFRAIFKTEKKDNFRIIYRETTICETLAEL
jgi:hypothetical protein